MKPHIIAVVVGVLSSTTWSQSINVRFGAAGGEPPANYAAAGLAGQWNNFEIPFPKKWPPPGIFGPFALVGLDDQPVDAVLLALNTVATLEIGVPANGPIGGDAQLLGGGLVGFSPDISQMLRFTGLVDGQYRLITYTWDWQAQLFGMVVFIEGEQAIPVGGPWTGALTLGVTHMEHIVDVAGGFLELEIVGAGPGSFFNGNNIIQGVQLWKIDEPVFCAADLSQDGLIDGEDLGSLLLEWGECKPASESGAGGTCPADLDDSGAVDGADLGGLLLGWGSCVVKPATCGDAKLGDCYSSHDGGGCAEPACCEAVCGFDSFCCEVAWDGLCVGLANLDINCSAGVHPHCGNPAAGNCFEAKTGLPGCEDPVCCDAVCAIDPFCCTFAWDIFCAEQANGACRAAK